LADDTVPYATRLRQVSRVAALDRRYPIEHARFTIPDLRMPKRDLGMSDDDLASMRKSLEGELFDSTKLSESLRTGGLRTAFPDVFAHYADTANQLAESGSATLRVMDEIKDNPGFARLPNVDQENLLWAALMRRTAKRPGVIDPGDDFASANITWGVLKSLDYHPNRIQRIANLIARRSELAYDAKDGPVSQRLFTDPKYLDDIAVFYRHPSAIPQLEMWNRAEAAIDPRLADVDAGKIDLELSATSDAIQKRVSALNVHTVPIVLTELPQRFGLVVMDKPYMLFGHVSDHLTGTFLDHLAAVESPEFSMSASLITENHQVVFHETDKPSLVALVNAPFEHISQAYRRDFGTGKGVGWERHVEATGWLADGSSSHIARFLESLGERARSVGVPGDTGLSSLANLRDVVAQHSSLDELVAGYSADHPFVRSMDQMKQGFTTNELGEESGYLNEFKINSASLYGIGIFRRNHPVYFEGVDGQTLLLKPGKKPDWLLSEPNQSAFVITRDEWQKVKERGLAFVVLDP
jgi:hypothetical protein